MQNKTLSYVTIGILILCIGASLFILYLQSEGHKKLDEMKRREEEREDMLSELRDRLQQVEAVLEKRKSGATIMSIVPPEGKPEQKPAGKTPPKRVVKTTEKSPEKQD